MWTTCAPVAKTPVERREDLGEDVRAARSAPRRPARRDRACCGRRTCGRAGRGRADASSSMLTSDELAPQTSAPSSSATRVSSACAPENATPSPMMIIGRVGAGEQRRPPGRPASASGDVRVCRHRRRHDRLVVERRRGRPSAAPRTPAPSAACAAILIARRSTRSTERRVDDPRRPLRHRPGHRDQVGGHLRVHRVVADARLAGDHDQRRAAALGLVHHPDAVAEPDAAVELDDRRLGAAPGRSRRRSRPRSSPAGSGCTCRSG